MARSCCSILTFCLVFVCCLLLTFFSFTSISEGASPSSVADLIDLATDWAAYHNSYDKMRAALEQAIAAAPGSVDSARAQVLLAADYIRTGDIAQADALFAQAKESNSDPDLAAFADLSKALALKANDKPGTHVLLVSAVETYRGTYTGGWAGLKLAASYRMYAGELDRALETLAQVKADLPGTRLAEEAEMLTAEVKGAQGKYEETIASCRVLAEKSPVPRVKLRAQIVLGCCLAHHDQYQEGYQALSQLLVQSSDDQPAGSLGRALRISVAREIREWKISAQDAQTYLSFPWAKSTYFIGEARLALGYLAQLERRFMQAIPDYEAAFAAFNELTVPSAEFWAWHRAMAHWGIGQSLFELGDLRGALESFRLAAAQRANEEQITLDLYRAAKVAEKLGDTTALNQIKEQMAREFPGNYLTALLQSAE